MQHHKWDRLFAVLVVAATACKPDPDDDGADGETDESADATESADSTETGTSLDDESETGDEGPAQGPFSDWMEALERGAEVACACDAVNGQFGGDPELCLEIYTSYLTPPAKRPCGNAYALERPELAAALNCMAESEDAYFMCLDEHPWCEAVFGGEFQCSDGSTIPGYWRCDGDSDCPDGSDEQDCEDQTFECLDGSGTVPNSWVCDVWEDCPDGSDELGCPWSACFDAKAAGDECYDAALSGLQGLCEACSLIDPFCFAGASAGGDGWASAPDDDEAAATLRGFGIPRR